MTTAIPPITFDQIIQTKSSPEIIVALLNEAENLYSKKPKHFNSRRAYPFWKTCKNCFNPFPCLTKEQSSRNRSCSKDCANQLIGKGNSGAMPLEKRKGQFIKCAVCGKEVWRTDSHLRKVKTPSCSRKCNGSLRGQEWATHAYKARAAWTEESVASFREKMIGEKNPAWKGGVTFFKTHGNYTGVKYIRCPVEFLEMARKDGYVMEHRILVAQAMGRRLLRSEVVHHVNHDPADNRIENLQLFVNNQAHKLYEARGIPAPIWSL